MLDTDSQTLKHLGRFYNHLLLEEMFQSVLRASMLRERGCLERVQTVSSDPGFQHHTRYRVLLDTYTQNTYAFRTNLQSLLTSGDVSECVQG